MARKQQPFPHKSNKPPGTGRQSMCKQLYISPSDSNMRLKMHVLCNIYQIIDKNENNLKVLKRCEKEELS